jgi:hypothetical protein
MRGTWIDSEETSIAPIGLVEALRPQRKVREGRERRSEGNARGRQWVTPCRGISVAQCMTFDSRRGE